MPLVIRATREWTSGRMQPRTCAGMWPCAQGCAGLWTKTSLWMRKPF